mgnify:CR=1 FL=1
MGDQWAQKQGYLQGDDLVNLQEIQEGNKQGNFEDPKQGDLLEILWVKSKGISKDSSKVEKWENVKEPMWVGFLDYFCCTVFKRCFDGATSGFQCS